MSEVYEKLRALIDVNPLGCPPGPEIIEIIDTIPGVSTFYDTIIQEITCCFSEPYIR